MSNRVIKLKLKQAREAAASSWDLAYKYENHPVLGNKFLIQAVVLDDKAAILASKLL